MDGQQIVGGVQDLRGAPLAKARGEAGWRCNGLVREAYARAGKPIGASNETIKSAELKAAGVQVGTPTVGDVVFFALHPDRPDEKNTCGLVTADGVMLTTLPNGIGEFVWSASNWHRARLLGYWHIEVED